MKEAGISTEQAGHDVSADNPCHALNLKLGQIRWEQREFLYSRFSHQHCCPFLSICSFLYLFHPSPFLYREGVRFTLSFSFSFWLRHSFDLFSDSSPEVIAWTFGFQLSQFNCFESRCMTSITEIHMSILDHLL